MELFEATRQGDIERVTLLLDQGVDVNTKDEEGRTSLHIASWRGHFDIASLLLKNGADINARDNFGDTSLHDCCWKESVESVNFLLKNGANTEIENNKKGKPKDNTSNDVILKLFEDYENIPDIKEPEFD